MDALVKPDAQAPPDARKRRHLPGTERERQIVESAAHFFAEHGFGGQTRELARGMGISHSAIFRYFPTKDALVERVYEHVFVRRWNPDWEALIQDRSIPLETRLIRFYCEYADRIFDYEWVRIFIQAGLKSNDITPRYLGIVQEKVIRPVCAEIRAAQGLPTSAIRPLSRREEESIWALHGQIFYIAIRKFIYNRPVPENYSQTITDIVQIFTRGISNVFPDLAETDADTNRC